MFIEKYDLVRKVFRIGEEEGGVNGSHIFFFKREEIALALSLVTWFQQFMSGFNITFTVKKQRVFNELHKKFDSL